MRNNFFLIALILPLIGLGQTPSDTLSRFLEPAAVTAVRSATLCRRGLASPGLNKRGNKPTPARC